MGLTKMLKRINEIQKVQKIYSDLNGNQYIIQY